MKTFASYADFAATARSERSIQNITPLVPDTNAPVQQISRLFQYQSYFDSVELQNALLLQNPNEPIVASTLKEEQIPGYAIGLHPSSQTPIAIQFKVGGQLTSSMPIILKPGQIERPHGLPPGMRSGSFSGFQWGIPFGWLGGGLATIHVFQTPDADVAWPGNNEVVFHRQRMEIESNAAIPVSAPNNWPTRFPWVNALRGTALASQQGLPAIAVEPTRVEMSLRLTTLAAPASMRIILENSNEFDLDSAGTPTGGRRFRDFIWPSFAAIGGAFPLELMREEIAKLSAGDGIDSSNVSTFGGIILTSADAALIGQFVDVVRFGRVG